MSIETTIRSNLSNLLKTISPEYYWNRKVSYIKQNPGEVEMKLLPALIDNDKVSIDIGAATGSFLVHLADYSKKVIGFEPLPGNVQKLNEMIHYTAMNAVIEPFALSSKSGSSILKMLENDPGRSTIEEKNDLQDKHNSIKKTIDIKVKKLDDYGYADIGFIKIDVEGHELSVLEGSADTIINNKPSFLIEVEERHKPEALEDVNHFLTQFDYSGYFILERDIIPVTEFDLDKYQNSNNIGDYTDNYLRKGIYINNFIFLPNESSHLILNKVMEYL